jgi:hypothetical protein
MKTEIPNLGGFFVFGMRPSQRAAVQRYISEARRKGRGLRHKHWHTEDFQPSALEGLVDSMIAWCRGTMAQSRRPYGIDLFDLIVSYRFEKDGKPRSFRLNKVPAMDLYQDLLPTNLLERLAHAMTPEQPVTVYISAAVFSWGDAADKALPATPANTGSLGRV